MRPREELPAAYVRSCEKFFNTFHSVDNEKFKRQAASRKLQASSLEELDPTIDWKKLIG